MTRMLSSLSISKSRAKGGKKRRKNGILREPTDFTGLTARPETHIKRRRVQFEGGARARPQRDTITWLGVALPMIVPGSKTYIYWQHAMVPPLVYESWAMCFRIVLATPGWGPQLLLDTVFDGWFLIVMLSRLWTPLEKKDGTLDKTKDSILQHFILNTLPIYILPCSLLYIYSLLNVPIWVWWVASLLRLPRLYLLTQYFSRMTMKPEVNARALEVLKLLLILYFSIHWTGCIFYFLDMMRDFGPHTWLYRFNERIFLSPYEPGGGMLWGELHHAVLQGMSALSNVGYDSLRPDNWSEMLFAVVVIGLPDYIGGVHSSTLFHHLISKDASLEDFRRKMSMMQHFVADRDLPAHLRHRLEHYLEFSYRKLKENYAGAIDIPRALALKVASAQFSHVVESSMAQGAPLRGCSDMFISTLTFNLQVTYLMPGEEFIRQGDIGRELGFVAAGVLDIIQGDTGAVVRSVYGDNLDIPSVVGEIAFFLSSAQPFKVVCRSTADAKVLVLSRGAYNELLHNFPEQNDVIVSNVLATFGLDAQGEDLPGWSGDTDDEDFALLRQTVHEAVVRSRDGLLNQLIYAVDMGEVDLVRNVIRKGVDVNTTNYDLCGCFKCLLEEGADKNIPDRWGQSPLHVALMSNNSMAVELLSKAGAVLTVLDPAAALCVAASEEDVAQ
eukprot:jgi/Tetstr1/436917/TSEL_025690.t1